MRPTIKIKMLTAIFLLLIVPLAYAAAKKITAMTELATTPASDDVYAIVDISEAAASDRNKKITAQNAATAITPADESTDTTCFPVFTTAATGFLTAKTGTNLTFNSNTGVSI